MRWKVKRKKSFGDKRVVRLFAYWPISVDREVRWLEWVEVKQWYDGGFWRTTEFLN